ncbi:hypothetical protein E1267_17330 [Nonomuraea longispora]|uniref:Uncharacterized protein n=1 Tax=Nonomuraea longispora TaxID=1848320 RepID=A0A4V2XKD6_9ACTN|nr:hypothetical protein [Nonomuraea longispora]TDC06186.1 hypothetical protein E1267_17330 [Nonomuraea longispora]
MPDRVPGWGGPYSGRDKWVLADLNGRGVFVGNGMLEHSWFPATYMPSGLRRPTVVVMMMLIGAAMYGTGLWLTCARSAAPRRSPGHKDRAVYDKSSYD